MLPLRRLSGQQHHISLLPACSWLTFESNSEQPEKALDPQRYTMPQSNISQNKLIDSKYEQAKEPTELQYEELMVKREMRFKVSGGTIMDFNKGIHECSEKREVWEEGINS